jgi:hypothetical protein
MPRWSISVLAGLGFALVAVAPARADATAWTPALFDLWAKIRTGTGTPVYWYSVGTLRSYPDGKLLARVEGYDTARSERVSPTLVRQFNRKIYIYRDAVTNAVITQSGGKPVEPVAYPYQYISYEAKDGGVESWVEQGSGKSVRRIGPGRDISVRTVGNSAAVFTAPVYLDFPAGAGRYQAFENYDFVVPRPYQGGPANKLSWVRYGDAPGFAGGGKSIMHLVTWRIDRYEDVPATLRDYVEAKAPLWKAPPKDLADIRRLQAAE